ncbi:MAG: hypothetical protein UY02_C0003G0009 [Candidatus Giovannonibacteria bacterium GW2011_GWB1_47_6b]|uniref:Uncharacterized protein n=1 Tax=Candidatus Giovannonibacteria bacterium GW2011_GWB1_47_6b TaxID=1618655 RepID=A0A0G1T671_9BACT|nr:MAG: hypothetical protein UY02_C0003G0009 [Candidatus Giovannonibacteria bacterium GW2011_GWB1_47_6b]
MSRTASNVAYIGYFVKRSSLGLPDATHPLRKVSSGTGVGSLPAGRQGQERNIREGRTSKEGLEDNICGVSRVRY